MSSTILWRYEVPENCGLYSLCLWRSNRNVSYVHKVMENVSTARSCERFQKKKHEFVKRYTGSDMNFHFIRYVWNELCFISPSLCRGDIKHTTSVIDTVLKMKIHFRFFLSHYNSEKYQCNFMKKVCILRKFRAKIDLKRRALSDVIMILLMTSLAKEARNWCKKCYVMCVLLENLWNGFITWFSLS